MTFLGIVVPGLAMAFAVRRWVTPVPWRIVALFLVLTLAFLHGAVFTSKLPVPVDEVMRGYPFHGLFPDVTKSRNGLTNDTVKLFLPWMQVAREELRHGRAPLWNRYSFSGYPLLANSESAPFSPLFLATLIVPLPKQIVAMAGLKIFVALLFMYLLLKREDVSEGAAVFGACAFAFSTFQTVYLYYSTTAVTALLPLAVFAILEGHLILIAIAIFTLLANGHPESVLHVAICVVAFLLIERRPWRKPLIGVAAGLLIAAPVWVPALQQVQLSARLQELRHAAAFVFPYSTAWSLIAPHHESAGLNYALFASSYAGLLPLALCIPGIARKRDRLLVLFAALCFIVAMNWTAVGHALNALPPFSITANDKLRFVSVFLIAFVAARTLKRWEWLAVAIVLADLFFYNVTFNALVDGKYFRPHLPIVDALRAHAPAEPFRIAGRDWVFLPNASAQYGLEDVRGSDPMELASYATFFRTFSTQEPGTDVKRVQDIDRPELDFLNVRFVFAEPDAQIAGKWRELYRGADGTLFENTQAERRFFASNAEITSIENRDPRKFRFTARAAQPATIMSSEPAAPGWMLRIDRKPALFREGTFLSFDVPVGEHRVDLIYRPRSFSWSFAATALGLLILIGAKR